jgi:hypothetical protein
VTRRRVLVLSFDPLTDAMAGPAIRAWQLASVLASTNEVVLAGTAGATRRHPSMRVTDVGPGGDEDLAELVDDAEMVFAPTSVVRRHPEVATAAVALAVDMYIPTHL